MARGSVNAALREPAAGTLMPRTRPERVRDMKATRVCVPRELAWI